MKKALFVLLLSAGTFTTGFAAESTTSSLAGDPVVELNDETLEYLISRARISVGTARGSVVDQLGKPQLMAHPDVWIFTGFRASNVFDAERYDTLIVVFKNDKVAKITLTHERTLREASARAKATAAKRVASAN